jgi:hypothetical protein
MIRFKSIRPHLFILILSTASILAIPFISTYFTQAFSINNITITMDYNKALKESKKVSGQLNFNQKEYKQAARFGLDHELRNYIELKHGGQKRFQALLKKELISPYTWSVRFFKEGEAHELTLDFTPSGKLYGFSEKLPESYISPSLTAPEAKKRIETLAKHRFYVDFNLYNLIQSSQKEQINGRVDHRFIFESKKPLQDSLHTRLLLEIKGSQITKFTPFINIPDSFKESYRKIRSANDIISTLSSLTILALYILGGLGLGIIFLIRKNVYLLKPALIGSSIITGTILISDLFLIPQQWMRYDTTLLYEQYYTNLFFGVITSTVGSFIFFTLILVVSEGLSRLNFGMHIQFWRLWSPHHHLGQKLLKMSIIGTLLVIPFIAYETALFYFTHINLGWWIPSDILIDPNLLSTSFPALTAISQSLQAGVIEECLFRVIPISLGVALIRKLKLSPKMIIIPLIVQAIIFGAAHANYPTQPSYARMIELTIPSIIFGLLYLRYGLLPGIILHVVYDLFWFSLPLFLLQSPSLSFIAQKLLVILFALSPLIIIGIRQLKQHSVEKEVLNSHHKTTQIKPPEHQKKEINNSPLPDILIKSTIVIGIASFIIFILLPNQELDIKLKTTRKEAIKSASQFIKTNTDFAVDRYSIQSHLIKAPGIESDYIHDQFEKKVRTELNRHSLLEPLWIIDFISFDKNNNKRLHSFSVYVNNSNGIHGYSRQLPNNEKGNSLSSENAKILILNEINNRTSLSPSDIQLMGTSLKERPNRRDWTFRFDITKSTSPNIRLHIGLSGDKLTYLSQDIYIPQEWTRSKKRISFKTDIISNICRFMYSGTLFTIFSYMVYTWAYHKQKRLRILWPLLIPGGMILSSSLLEFPNSFASFTPTISPWIQTVFLLLITTLKTVAATASLYICTSFIGSRLRVDKHIKNKSMKRSLLLPTTIGTTLYTLPKLIETLTQNPTPTWPDIHAMSTLWPNGSVILNALTQNIILIIIIYLITTIAQSNQKRKTLISILIITFTLVNTGSYGIENIQSWITTGVLKGILISITILFFTSRRPTLIPYISATLISLSLLDEGSLHAYKHSDQYYFLAIFFVIFSSYLIERLSRPSKIKQPTINKHLI